MIRYLIHTHANKSEKNQKLHKKTYFGGVLIAHGSVKLNKMIAQSAEAVEYTDCFSAEG